MHLYIIIYIIILTLSFFEIINKWDIKVSRFIYVILWLFLALFAGTRVCTGGDWIAYGNIFKEQGEGAFKFVSFFGGELLFRLIAHVVSNLGLEFKHFLLIISLATSCLIAKSFYMLYPKRIFLLTLLYYSVAFFNQQFLLIRSGLAAALFIYGISYLLRGSKIKFVVVGISTFYIHATSIIPFSLAYVLKRKLSKRIIIPILAFATILNLFKNYLFAALEFILRITKNPYVAYFDLGGRFTAEGKIINTVYLVSLFLLVYMYNKIKDIPTIFVNIAILFVAVNIAMPFLGVMPRFNLYLLMPVWIFMVYITTNVNKHVSLALNLLIVVYAFVAISKIVSTPDLVAFQRYQSWLLDSSLKWEDCSCKYQY